MEEACPLNLPKMMLMPRILSVSPAKAEVEAEVVDAVDTADSGRCHFSSPVHLLKMLLMLVMVVITAGVFSPVLSSLPAEDADVGDGRDDSRSPLLSSLPGEE